jgi:hypothetical protein
LLLCILAADETTVINLKTRIKDIKDGIRRAVMMSQVVDNAASLQALRELQSILKKPYKDVCNVCKGTGAITSQSTCPKCKGSGQRLLRLM